MTDDRKGNRSGAYWDQLRSDKAQIVDVRAEEIRHRTLIGRVIARAGQVLAHPLFFGTATLFHLLWVLLNVPALSPIDPWDPYPFMLLATIASVEAPILALLILMRQQQDARIAELREDTSLQTSLHAERETTKLLRMVEQVHEALGIETEHRQELAQMEQPLRADRLVETIETKKDADDEAPSSPSG